MKKWFLRFSILFIGLTVLGQGCGAIADGGVFRSDDQAESWEQRVFVGQEGRKVFTIDDVNVQKIVFEPGNNEVLYLATKENGLYKTDTRGEQWYQLPLAPDRIRDVAIDPNNTDIVFTVRGNTVLKSSDAGASWEIVYTDAQNAIITRIAIDWYDSERIYAVTSIGTVLLSEDGGHDWRVLTQVDEPLIGIIIDPNDSRIIYTLELDKTVYKTTDGGVTWDDLFFDEELEEPIENVVELPKQLIMDPNNSAHLWLVGTYGIAQSFDSGKTWELIDTLIAQGAPENSSIATFTVLPGESGTLFFTVGNIIHKSFDSGKTWKTIETFPSGRKITAMVIDSEDPTIMYAGTEVVESSRGGLIPTPGN